MTREKRIEFIIRGDSGDYTSECFEDMEFFFDIMTEVTSAGISLLCRTPDGDEHIHESTSQETNPLDSPCDHCKFLDLCREQAGESYDGDWNECLEEEE